jgi:hypothetical protein
MEAAKDDMATALDELRSVREEYEEWKDNLPENLQGSTLYDKLEEVCGLDIPDDPGDSTYSDLEEVVDNAEGVDLPLGFGRD